MKNKNVGFLIIGLGIIIITIIIIFNYGMKDIVSQSCSHGPTCPMYRTIKTQTYFSLAIAIVVILIGLFFIFAKESEKIIVKQKTKIITERKKPRDKKGLDRQEKAVIELIEKENGVVFQRDLIEKLNIGKVGITRLLDKLEAKQFIERKRRGMNNIIVLKN
jgi:uncharacterized membrane protein